MLGALFDKSCVELEGKSIYDTLENMANVAFDSILCCLQSPLSIHGVIAIQQPRYYLRHSTFPPSTHPFKLYYHSMHPAEPLV